MGILNSEAIEAISGIDKYDAKYCASLASRLSNMNLSSSKISNAITSIVEKDAVPTFIPTVATPSMFSNPQSSVASDTTCAEFELETATAA